MGLLLNLCFSRNMLDKTDEQIYKLIKQWYSAIDKSRVVKGELTKRSM
jgi:hypothetical protein